LLPVGFGLRCARPWADSPQQGMGFLVLLTTAVLACVGLSAIQCFVSPSLPATQSPGLRLAHAEARDVLFSPGAAPIDAGVSGYSGMWAGAFASLLGAAAAVSGLRGGKASAGKRTPRRGVVMNAGPNALDQLRTMTKIVADTGVLEDIKKYKPTDATTNPTLVLRALSGPDAKSYFDRAIAWSAAAGHKIGTDSEELVEDICDRLAVLLGSAILGIVPGVVSTEVDARLSYDTDAMLAKGRKLSKLYEEQGHGKDKVLVKLASTWEAMEACRQLQAEGIRCNMTLVLSLSQAVAAAEANATLISPFVGRILDWYKNDQKRDYTPDEDPGVKSVKEIFNYYKTFGYETIVMGASFRSAGEVLALAGCDNMTIAPALLNDLEGLHIQVQQRLDAGASKDVERLEEGGLTEKTFRWQLNEDPMATELLAKGIRSFGVDGRKLEEDISSKKEEVPSCATRKRTLFARAWGPDDAAV